MLDPPANPRVARIMSLIKQFSIGCSKTINLGNFQSIKVEASVVVEVPEDETLEGYTGMTAKAQAELGRLLAETYANQHKKDRQQ